MCLERGSGCFSLGLSSQPLETIPLAHLTPREALGVDERGGVEHQAPVTALNPLNKPAGQQKRRLGAGGVAPGEDASLGC